MLDTVKHEQSDFTDLDDLKVINVRMIDENKIDPNKIKEKHRVELGL